MENAGNGTTMSAGVTTPIASSVNTSEAQIEPARPEQRRGVSASEEIKSIKPKVRENDVETADNLIIIAKRDGVDEALERLAHEDVEQVQDGEVKEKFDAQKNKEPEDERETKPNLLEKEVHELAARVEKFAETNSDIRKRLEQVEEMNRLAMLTIYEMAQILRKMIEDSEEENKQSLLMILAQIMAKMMELMFVPDEEDGIADGQTSEERQLERMAA